MASALDNMEDPSGLNAQQDGEHEFFTPPGSSESDQPMNETKQSYFPYNEEKTLQHVRVTHLPNASYQVTNTCCRCCDVADRGEAVRSTTKLDERTAEADRAPTLAYQ